MITKIVNGKIYSACWREHRFSLTVAAFAVRKKKGNWSDTVIQSSQIRESLKKWDQRRDNLVIDTVPNSHIQVTEFM